MDLAALLVADAANVREGLVSILGGGITRLFQVDGGQPALSLVAVIAVPPEDFGRSGQIAISVWAPDGSTPVSVEGDVVVEGDASAVGGLPVMVPLAFQVATAALLASPGMHRISVRVDESTRTAPILVRPPGDKSMAVTTVKAKLRDVGARQEAPGQGE